MSDREETNFEKYGHKITNRILSQYKEQKIYCGGEEHGYVEFMKFCDQRFQHWAKINFEPHIASLLPTAIVFAGTYFFHEPEAMGLTTCSEFLVHNALSFRGVFSTNEETASHYIARLWDEYRLAMETSADLDNQLAWTMPATDYEVPQKVAELKSRMEYHIDYFKTYVILTEPRKSLSRESNRPAKSHVLVTLGYQRALMYLNCGKLSELIK